MGGGEIADGHGGDARPVRIKEEHLPATEAGQCLRPLAVAVAGGGGLGPGDRGPGGRVAGRQGGGGQGRGCLRLRGRAGGAGRGGGGGEGRRGQRGGGAGGEDDR